MQENDKSSQQELKRLRSLSGNKTCADCDRQDNSWASVTHGVFICMICSDVHRSVGTHISKVKGCTGTYLWGPDELEKMRTAGNQHGNSRYGTKKMNPDASKEQKQRYVVEKYDKLSFVSQEGPAPCSANALTDETVVSVKHPTTTLRKASAVEMQPAQPFAPKTVTAPIACATTVSESWFDDFFKEDTVCCTNSAVPLKLNETHVSKSTEQPSNDMTQDLDAFLDIALHAQVKPKLASVSAYPASLDPFQMAPPVLVADPFSDWPEF